MGDCTALNIYVRQISQHDELDCIWIPQFNKLLSVNISEKERLLRNNLAGIIEILLH